MKLCQITDNDPIIIVLCQNDFFLKLYLKVYLREISTHFGSWLSRKILRTLTYSLKVMKNREIIVMVQSFGHFDRINFLKLFPEVNLRDISKNI